MSGSDLFRTVPDDSGLLLLSAEWSPTANLMLSWQAEGLTVRVLRGPKMRTLDALFDEAAAALQFPLYFGENWNAFHECLSQTDWPPGTAGVVLVITDAFDVLADEPAELPVLVRSIAHAVSAYSKPIARGQWWDRPAIPYHVVLHSPASNLDATRARWEPAGAAPAPLRVDDE